MFKPSVLSLSLLALLGLGATLNLTACANYPANEEHTESEPAEIRPANASTPLSVLPANHAKGSRSEARAQAFYLLMQAELAGQRGKVTEAGKLYLRAAQLGRDARTAERALKIALLARDTQTSDEALALWIELEPSSATRWPMQVLLAMRHQDDAEALRIMQQNLPTDEAARKESYQQIATMLIHEGAGILPVLHRFTQSHPNDADAWLTLAHVALNFKEFDTARAALRKTIKLDPKRKDAYLLLAESYFSQKDAAAGIEVLHDMVQQFPQDQRLSLTYARALHEAGRTQDARDLLAKLLRQSPSDHDLRFAVALMALESGDFKTAERELKTLYKHKDRAATAAYYLGRLEEQRGNTNAAMRWYAQTQGGAQQNEIATEALLRMAQIDLEAGRITAAQEHLTQARALSPSDEERVRFYLIEAQLLRQAERIQAAYELILQALNEVPGEPDLLYSRALLAEQLGLHEQAEADLRAILAQDPENPEALNALGFTLAERNVKLDEAYQLINTSLKLNPKSAATIDSMGWVLYRQGKLTEAENYLRQAFSLDQDAEIAGHLIEVLIAMKRFDEARTLLDEALKRDPQNKPLLKLDALLRAERPAQP